MRHYFLAFAVLLFFNLHVHAQADNDRIVISLNPGSMTIDTTFLHSVSAISLQVSMQDTSVIGYTSDTASYTTYSLVPQTQITTWMQTFVDQAYGASFSAIGSHVYWLIKNFDLSESVTTSRVYVHVQASIYSGFPGNTSAYWELDTLLNYTHLSGDSYSIPFQNAIQTLVTYSASRVKSTGRAASRNISQSNRRNNSQSLRDFSDFHIVKDSVVNEGAFITLSQFVNNNPTVQNITIVADSASTNGAVHVYKVNSDSTATELTSLVALCIGGELYAYRNQHIIALERTSNAMLIARYRDPDERINQALHMRMVLQFSPGNENPFSKEYRCTKPGYQDVVATCVDLDTGDLSF